MTWSFAGVLFVAVLAASLAATRLALSLLHRRAILDLPNERSSHSVPTPRGGGIAVMAVVVAGWLSATAMLVGDRKGVGIVTTIAGGLALLSWLDDLRELPAAVRLLGHGAAVALTMIFLPAPAPYFGGLLPALVDDIAAGLIWVWFINLFNFMDGIDGIAGGEVTALGLGIAVVAILGGLDGGFPVYGLILAAAALGFLWWNRPPARIFLGDVGSIPLGYLLGWLLLGLAAAGQPMAAVILPLYYLADATLTLGRRALRGEKVWQAHREHFYQRAVQTGRSHGAVVAVVAVANLLLIVLATLATAGQPFLATVAAVALVGALLFHLGRGAAAP